MYKNFDEILTNSTVNHDARLQFTVNWLQENYGITAKPETPWVNELSLPHDHDGLPKHFGKVQLPSGLARVGVQLGRNLKGKWSLVGFRKPDASDAEFLPSKRLGVEADPASKRLLTFIKELNLDHQLTVVPKRTLVTFPATTNIVDPANKYAALTDGPPPEEEPHGGIDHLLLDGKGTYSVEIL